MFWNTALQAVLYFAAVTGLPRVVRRDNPGMQGVILERNKESRQLYIHWGAISFSNGANHQVRTWNDPSELSLVRVQGKILNEEILND